MSVKDVFIDTPVVKCYLNREAWQAKLNRLMQDLIFGSHRLGVAITTVATGSDRPFLDSIATDKVEKIVIGDEVHNLGAAQSRRFLAIAAQARIGLSATPIRPYDEEGNRALSEYFGETIYTLPIKEAIQKGFLVPYDYSVSFCVLTDAEYEEYCEVSAAIAQLYGREGAVDEDRLRFLLMKRARVLSTCESKLRALGEVSQEIRDQYGMLVFTAEDPHFFAETYTVLAKAGLTVLTITCDTSHEDRGHAIELLQKRDIHCILAMRCLDEGVDIPSADKAIILASSVNQKQYIQRRGRVLRKCGMAKRAAEIHDFLVVPQALTGGIDEALYGRQLRRILEFASCAQDYSALKALAAYSRRNDALKTFADLFQEFDI